jgi:hypothetical protein
LSDGEGIAQISGWTLGSSGVQSLTATAEGLASVTFTATIPDNPCAPLSLAPGTAGQSMDVEAFSCALPDGRRANFFTLNVTTAGVYDLSSESSTFRNTVTLATSSGTSVGEGSTSPSLSTRFRAYLEKGQYMMRVASSLPADRGSYRISVVSTLDPTRGCQDTFLSIGSQISEVLEQGDCEFGRGLFADQYRVFVAAGSQLTVTMGSVEVDNVISVMDPDGDFVTGTNASSLEGGVYGARVGFTALKTGYYLVIATTAYFPGPYSLIVQSLK